MSCLAITARGYQCGREHWTECPITFSWDPTRGYGTGAPSVTLCHLHDYMWELEAHERVEIVGGWLGRAWNPEAKCWTVSTTVYAARDGLAASPHWWGLRRPIKTGYREPTYEQVVAQDSKPLRPLANETTERK